jgi:Right handed beta helix region/Secretion system C-terminal sorting domain
MIATQTRMISLLFLFFSFLKTTAQTTEVTATYHNIGIELSFAVALPPNTVVNLFIKKDTETVYKESHPLTKIANTIYAGSAVQLSENTNYNIKLTSTSFTDILINTKTKSGAYNQLDTNVLYVSATGSDTNTGTSIGLPFKTLGKALNSVGANAAGTTIYMLNGTYYEGNLSILKSGTLNNPLTIRNYPGHSPVIDGSDTTFSPTWTVHDAANNVYKVATALIPEYAYINGEHLFHYLNLNDLITKKWNLKSGFFHDGTTLYVRFPAGTSPSSNTIIMPKYSTGLEIYQQSNIVIKGLEFRYLGYAPFPRGVYIHASNNVIVDACKFHHTHVGVALKRNADFNTVQNCSFNESPKSRFDWDAVKTGGVPYEEGGIIYYTSSTPNKGNVFRSNTFKDLFDGMAPGSEDNVGFTSNLDIYDNTFDEIGDDAISLDGVATNTRVYNNTFTNFLVGISAAPLQRGPNYLFRNVLYNSASSAWQSNSVYTPYPFKFNVGSTFVTNWVYLYHNTSYSDIANCDGFTFKNYSNWYDIVSRNNIYAGANYAFASYSASNPINFDYDNLYTSNATKLFYWNNTNYSTLSAFTTASGQEANGKVVNPSFVSVANNDFQLSSSSLLINQGQIIKGFNDNFVGTKPDIGRFEFGQGLGIEDNDFLSKTAVILYPNPVTNTLNIKTNNENIGTVYLIRDVLGRVLMSGKITNELFVISIENIPVGVYAFEVEKSIYGGVKFIKQ